VLVWSRQNTKITWKWTCLLLGSDTKKPCNMKTHAVLCYTRYVGICMTSDNVCSKHNINITDKCTYGTLYRLSISMHHSKHVGLEQCLQNDLLFCLVSWKTILQPPWHKVDHFGHVLTETFFMHSLGQLKLLCSNLHYMSLGMSNWN